MNIGYIVDFVKVKVWVVNNFVFGSIIDVVCDWVEYLVYRISLKIGFLLFKCVIIFSI